MNPYRESIVLRQEVDRLTWRERLARFGRMLDREPWLPVVIVLGWCVACCTWAWLR